MTTQLEKFKGPSKRKRLEDDISEASIFDILENEFQPGDIVWAKLYGMSWWPAFVYGCFSEDWNHVKVVSKLGMSSKKQYFVYCFGAHLKYKWVSQARLHRYEGLDEFLTYSVNQVGQAITKRAETQIRQRLKLPVSEEQRSSWREAIEEANKMIALPIHSRIDMLRKMIHQMIAGKKEQMLGSNRQQAPQMLSSLCNLPTRAVVVSEAAAKPRTTLTCSSTSKETVEADPSTKTQGQISRSFQTATTNELDSDVVMIRLNTPSQPSSVSLTTAICHFLDRGIPSLTLYEESCLVNKLLNHQLGASLTLTDAQLYVEQYVMRIASSNFHHCMPFVQGDYFYDFLLKYPQIILQHRQWFKDFQQSLMPVYSDKIQLKKWQLATLLHAHHSQEQRGH